MQFPYFPCSFFFLLDVLYTLYLISVGLVARTLPRPCRYSAGLPLGLSYSLRGDTVLLVVTIRPT